MNTGTQTHLQTNVDLKQNLPLVLPACNKCNLAVMADKRSSCSGVFANKDSPSPSPVALFGEGVCGSPTLCSLMGELTLSLQVCSGQRPWGEGHSATEETREDLVLTRKQHGPPPPHGKPWGGTHRGPRTGLTHVNQLSPTSMVLVSSWKLELVLGQRQRGQT